MSDIRERARAHFEHMFKGLDYSSVGRKELAIDFAAAFAESEAALARKQERMECAKAVCPACAMPERFDPPQGNEILMTHRERGSGGIATCRAAAIHERNLAETGA